MERVNSGDEEEAYCVTSPKAKCLLDELEETWVDLKGYCDMTNMLEFRLEKESAVVMVSSMESEDGRLTASVGSMRKVEPHALAQQKALLAIEWKTALTDLGADVLDFASSPARPDYWEEQRPARKARRVLSDAQSPAKASGA